MKKITREEVRRLRSHFGVSSLCCVQETYTLQMKDGSRVKIPGSVYSAFAGDVNRPADKIDNIDYENAVILHKYYSDEEVTEKTSYEIV